MQIHTGKKTGGLGQLRAVCLEEPEDWFEQIDIKAAWDYGFFLKNQNTEIKQTLYLFP